MKALAALFFAVLLTTLAACSSSSDSTTLAIAEVRVFPGSGVAFDHDNPSVARVFVSSELDASESDQAGEFLLTEYTVSGELVDEARVQDPSFGFAEGLSFFATSNLLLAGVLELEEATPEGEELVELEFSFIKEYGTDAVPTIDGLSCDLAETLGGHLFDDLTFTSEFELEGLIYDPARDSIFGTGELEATRAQASGADEEVEMQFLVELDPSDCRLIEAYDLAEFAAFASLDAEGLGYNAANGMLLWVGNYEDDDEGTETAPDEERSKLVVFSVGGMSLDVSLELDLDTLGIGEAEGVAYDHTTETLFIAEEPDEADAGN